MYALSIPMLFAFQTVCISEATRFLVLTAGQSHAHVHLKLSVTIETWKDENSETFFPPKTLLLRSLSQCKFELFLLHLRAETQCV